MKTPKSVSAELRIYRIKTLCELLGVTRITLWRWVRRGIFPRPVQLGPNTKGVPKEDFDAWMDARRAAAKRRR